MLRRFLLYITLGSLLFAPSFAFAHILQTDGSIGAVIHVNPDDDPIAGEPSSFFFEFKDKQNKFAPANCNCSVSIMAQGKQIYTQPLFENTSNPSLTSASFSYTFPETNVYQVMVKGEPTTPNSFQLFTLTYDIRVSRTAQTVTPKPSTQSNWISGHTIHIIGALAITLVLIGMIIHERINQK